MRKDRHIPEQYMGDIYDRKVWDSFKKYNGVSFLEDGFNYAFMLNCDWFQPFKQRKDISIGVMYLVVLNLPRHLRFKRENMILVGVIPSFSKEPESLNSFLNPLVKESNQLWKE